MLHSFNRFDRIALGPVSNQAWFSFVRPVPSPLASPSGRVVILG